MDPDERMDQLSQMLHRRNIEATRNPESFPQQGQKLLFENTGTSSTPGNAVSLALPIPGTTPIMQTPSAQQHNPSSAPTTHASQADTIRIHKPGAKKSARKPKIYGVHWGQAPGVYRTLEEAKNAARGVPYGFLRSFHTQKEASDYVSGVFKPCGKQWFGVRNGRCPGVFDSYDKVVKFSLLGSTGKVAWASFKSEKDALEYVQNRTDDADPKDSKSTTGMVTGPVEINARNPKLFTNTLATLSNPVTRSEPVIPPMATPTTNESIDLPAVGNRTSPAKRAIDSHHNHVLLVGDHTLAGSGPPPLKKIRVGNATLHQLENTPQSNLHNQVSAAITKGQDSDSGTMHINPLLAGVIAQDKSPSNIPVVDLADCSGDETYAEAIEEDGDDDDSGEYSISPSEDADNTPSMTIPLPSLEQDELNLLGWFDNKTVSRVKNRLTRALRPYVPPPPLPAGQKRPPGRPKKNPVPVPVATIPAKRGRPRKNPVAEPVTTTTTPAKRGRPRKNPVADPVTTTPAKRGRPRKNPLPAPVTTPAKRSRPKKVIGGATTLSATTAAIAPVGMTRTAHVWTTPTVRRARAASV